MGTVLGVPLYKTVIAIGNCSYRFPVVCLRKKKFYAFVVAAPSSSLGLSLVLFPCYCLYITELPCKEIDLWAIGEIVCNIRLKIIVFNEVFCYLLLKFQTKNQRFDLEMLFVCMFAIK